MKLVITDSAKYSLAKSFTELAIQNNLFMKKENPADTAKDIALFFDTVIRSIDSDQEEK